MNKKMLKKFIIILLMLECFSIFLTYKSVLSKSIKLDDVILKDNDNINTLAVYLQNENGVYVANENSEFPESGYTFNSSKSGCMDGNGNIVDNVLNYNENTKNFDLKMQSSVYCYVYFDRQ